VGMRLLMKDKVEPCGSVGIAVMYVGTRGVRSMRPVQSIPVPVVVECVPVLQISVRVVA